MVHGSTLSDHSAAPPPGPPPGAPASCQGRHRVSPAFRWWAGDPGDPTELLSGYLEANGLPVRDIGRTAPQVHPVVAGTVCGAALYVSAAAGAVMAGPAPGPPSPVPDIPDVYAAIYVHAPSLKTGADRRPG